MQRIAFTMRIKPGTQEEYRRRHRQVWPELLADLKRAGCKNYSIYLRDTELFAYMEVEDFQRYLEVMAASPVSEPWEAQMSDILIRETEEDTGFPPVLEEVFHLDEHSDVRNGEPAGAVPLHSSWCAGVDGTCPDMEKVHPGEKSKQTQEATIVRQR